MNGISPPQIASGTISSPLIVPVERAMRMRSLLSLFGYLLLGFPRSRRPNTYVRKRTSDLRPRRSRRLGVSAPPGLRRSRRRGVSAAAEASNRQRLAGKRRKARPAIAPRLSPRAAASARPCAAPRSAGQALQAPRRGRVHALVAVIPLDAVARLRVLVDDLTDDARAGVPVGRARLLLHSIPYL